MWTRTGNLTHQWTKARLAYMRSNLRSSLAHASTTAVVLVRAQTARETLARSPPGTIVGGWWLMPTLKPVGHLKVASFCGYVAEEELVDYTNIKAS